MVMCTTFIPNHLNNPHYFYTNYEKAFLKLYQHSINTALSPYNLNTQHRSMDTYLDNVPLQWSTGRWHLGWHTGSESG